MELARKLERRLERLVDGLAVMLFRGDLHPVELAGRLVREADLALVEGPAGVTAPNHFTLRVARDAVDDAQATSRVADELGVAVTETAAERGWRLEGPASVLLVPDGRLAVGSLRCKTAVIPGPLPAWAHLDRAGELALRHNREVVGRSGGADILLADGNASRRHALIWREAGSVWIADLGSSNGTLVNGTRITAVTPLGAGDALTFGGTTLTYRPV